MVGERKVENLIVLELSRRIKNVMFNRVFNVLFNAIVAYDYQDVRSKPSRPDTCADSFDLTWMSLS